MALLDVKKIMINSLQIDPKKKAGKNKDPDADDNQKVRGKPGVSA